MATKPKAWRMARALDKLLSEVNAFAPRRSKASDGGIGDAAHASRSSDHNPWHDVAGVGVVTARDFTHDPDGGLDCDRLAEMLTGEARVKYIIWNKRIMSGTGQKSAAWKWRRYTGKNGHTKHLHVSVKPETCDVTTTWSISGAIDPKQVILKLGAHGAYVEDLQRNLGDLGYTTIVDGRFGQVTDRAVRKFQTDNGLVVDGIAGNRTQIVIGEALKAKETKPKIAAAMDAVEPVANQTIAPGEMLAGVTAVGTGATAVKQTVDAVNDGATSLLSLGPWVLAGVIGVGFGWYVWRDLRTKKAAAVKAARALE